MRKFVLAMSFGAATTALCWFGHMSGGDCALVLTTLAGLYKAANIVDKKLGGAG